MNRKFIYILIVIFIFASSLWGEAVDFVVIDGFGPYALSNTEPQNLKVFLGKNIINEADYNLHQDKGTIYFVNPPLKGKIVKISYTLTEKSQKQPNLNFNVVSDSENKISYVDTAYKDTLMGGDLNMNVALKNTDGSVNSDNLGGKISYLKKMGNLTLGSTYATTGDNLDNVGNYKADNDLFQILAKYNESNVSLDTKVTKYESTGEISSENKLNYAISKKMNWSFGYNSKYFEDDETDKYERVSDFYETGVSYSGGDNFKISSLYKYNTEKGADALSESNTSFTYKLKNYLSVNLNYANYKNMEKSSESKSSLTFNPIKALAMNVRYNSVKTNGVTDTDTKTSLKFTPKDTFKMNLDYNDIKTGEEIQSETNTYLYLKPWQFMSFDYKFRNTKNSKDSLDENKTSLSFTPWKAINMTVNYLNRELASDDRFAHLKLTGNYKIDKFVLYAMLIKRNAEGMDYEDTKSARLTYEVFKFLELSSQWTDNPEDGDLYFDTTQYNYGMKLKFGDIALSGNMYESKNAFDIRTDQKFDIGLSAKLFGGALSGSVVYNKIFGDTKDFYRKYVLGYSKKLGNRFSLSLSGEYDERDLNEQGFKKEDMKGNFNMNFNF